MNLDQLLRDALHDDRLALPVPADTLHQVRRLRRRRQRLTVAVATVSALGLAGGAVALLPGSSSSARLSPYSADGVPTGSPVPGVSPDWVPANGSEWLLTEA